MQEELAKMQKENARLKWQSDILTLLEAAGLFAFTSADATRFKGISVERINVLDSNGQLRRVISNQSRSPENVAFAQGVFVGQSESKTAMAFLPDRMSRPRLKLFVDSSGVAKPNFLDQ